MTIGTGTPDKILNENQIYDICVEGFKELKLNDERFLFIIPDLTRTAPIDIMFRMVYKLLAHKVKRLDFIIALGTHPALSQEVKVGAKVVILTKQCLMQQQLVIRHYMQNLELKGWN